MSKYRLLGKAFINQYCHVKYKNLSILKICRDRDDCVGHEIIVAVDETVVGENESDALDNSLSSYEGQSETYIKGGGDGLEPTWWGRPTITKIE